MRPTVNRMLAAYTEGAYLLLSCLLLHSSDTLSLLGNAGSTAFASSPVFNTASLHLVGQDLGAGLLSLGLVDVLHQHALVLEDVTLRLLVEDVVQMLIYLSSFSVFPEQSPKHSLSPHPQHFGGHPGLGGTLSFTSAGVTALSFGGEEIACAGARVDGGGLDDDTAIFNELLDVGAGVGVSDLSLFGGVEPDFSFADARDAGGKALLRPEINHICRRPWS